MSQAGTNSSSGSGGSGIKTIDHISPDGSGNFTIESSDTSIVIVGISNGINLTLHETPISTIDGDIGTVSGSTVTITADFAGGGCGGTVLFTGDDMQTLTLSVSDNNFNTGVGVSAVGQVISTGSNNSCFGTAAGSLIYTGSNNSSLGYSALFGATDFSGSDNIAIGYNSATNYVTSESNNIIMGNIGVASESNVIRIGTQGSGTGQQDKCFIAGIEGVTVSNLNYVTIDTATGQLGSAATGGGIVTIDGDSGSITGTTVKIYANTASTNCGSSVKFVNSGTTSTLNVTDTNDNVIIGNGSGNSSISGTVNSFLGFDVAPSLTSGSANVGIGAGSLNSVTMGGHNVVVGENSLALLSSGNFNSALGQSAGGSLATGQYNTFLGYNSGQAYTSSESSNILIGNNGVISESNTIRIGTQGSSSAQQNTCYVAGIAGVTGTSSAVVAGLNTSNGQLLQTTVTAGLGISVTPAAGTITIAATGSEMTWTDKSTSFNAVAGNGYFITAGSVVATLPASPSQGNTISFVVDTSSSFELLANTGQVIRIGSAVSASAGNAVNNAQGDSVTLVYRSSDTAWIATSVIGTWTVT